MLDIHDVIRWAKHRYPSALFVSTTGYITRDLLQVKDDATNFYLVGSMGMAAPIGLGIAMARPHRRVIVLDGDGSFAMNTGALLSIGASETNLIHLVLDNGSHASTGGQRTVGLTDPVGLAQAAGYAHGLKVENLSELDQVTPADKGPTIVHARCSERSGPIGGRLQLTPQELVERFRSEVEVPAQ